MKSKKIMALVLASAMTLGGTMTAFASESEAITFPLAEPMTVTLVTNYYDDQSKVSENLQWAAYEEMTNVKFENTEILGSEAKEKINLMFAGGEYPEAFYRADIDTFKYGVEEGFLLPLEDLIREYAPNLTKILDENDLWDAIKSSDGNIYGLPSFNPAGTRSWVFRYNKKWLDNLGMEAPTNVDELYECLKAIKEQDANGNGDANDEIPMTFASNGFDLMALFGYMYQDGVADTASYLTYDGEDFKEVGYVPASEQFKEFVKTCQQWYAEGLIDQNCFTQPYDDLYTITSTQDQYGFFVANALGGEEYSKNFHIMPVLEGVGGIATNNGVFSKSAFVLTDKCENPETLIAWADYWYTEEGSTMAMNGIEGVNYEYDEDGYRVKLETENDLNPSLQVGTYIPVNFTNDIKALNVKYKDTESWDTAIFNEEVELLSHGVKSPTFTIAEDDSERANDISTSLSEYVGNQLALFVTGEKDIEAEWDAYLAELDKIGLQEYLGYVIEAMPEGYALAE